MYSLPVDNSLNFSGVKFYICFAELRTFIVGIFNSTIHMPNQNRPAVSCLAHLSIGKLPFSRNRATNITACNLTLLQRSNYHRH
jgi:hypothetical protein